MREETKETFNSVADIENELRHLAKIVMGTSLQPLAVVFSSFAAHLHDAWKREKAEIEASALDAGGIVSVDRYRRAILDFCNIYCMVYPPGDPDVPVALQGAFQNFCDELGIEQVKLGESEASK